jgi:hypothetical protein
MYDRPSMEKCDCLYQLPCDFQLQFELILALGCAPLCLQVGGGFHIAFPQPGLCGIDIIVTLFIPS